MATLNNSFRTHVGFYFETVPGFGPGLAPPAAGGAGDAAGWVTAEAGSDAFRMFVIEADPAFIRGQQAVPNADMQQNVYSVGKPHKGLGNAEGGALVSRVWGTNDVFNDGVQVLGGTASELGRLLGHALGGGAIGGYTTIASVADQTTFDVVTAANLQPGYLIRIADVADPDRAYYVQVLTVAGSTVTIDRKLPFVIAAGSLIYGTEMAWPDAQVLTDCDDPDYSTIGLLIQKGPDVWVACGGHLALNELRLERGQEPQFAWDYNAAASYPPHAGGPTEPAWAGTPAGLSADVGAVGHSTILFLQDYAATDWNCELVFEASFTAGVPVTFQEGVTDCKSATPGVIAFKAEPADTILTVTVPLTAKQQERWVQGTEVTASYMQVGPVGKGYCVHIAKGFLMDAPEAVVDGVNKWRIQIQARHDDLATTAPQSAKFVVAR